MTDPNFNTLYIFTYYTHGCVDIALEPESVWCNFRPRKNEPAIGIRIPIKKGLPDSCFEPGAPSPSFKERYDALSFMTSAQTHRHRTGVTTSGILVEDLKKIKADNRFPTIQLGNEGRSYVGTPDLFMSVEPRDSTFKFSNIILPKPSHIERADRFRGLLQSGRQLTAYAEICSDRERLREVFPSFETDN